MALAAVETAVLCVNAHDGVTTAARKLARLARSPRFGIVHVHGPLPTVAVRLAPRHRPVVTTSHTPWDSLRWPTRLAWRATAGLDADQLAKRCAQARSHASGTSRYR